MPKVPLSACEHLLEEKGSRFIALLSPLHQADDVRLRQQQAAEQHPKASHVVYGWRLSDSNGTISEGFSDDGEPSGTAGMPVLRQLQHAGAVNILILVVRYFGGTKLGTGGLQRAYAQSAREALESLSQWQVWKQQTNGRVTGDFHQEAGLRRLILEAGGEISGADYSGTGVSLCLTINSENVDELRQRLPFNTEFKEIQAVRD